MLKTAFTDLFVRKPVLACVIAIAIIVAGIQAATSLTVRQYPRNDNSVVTISTVYVGASAELVRGFVTTPLERAIAGAKGIDYISSSSAENLSTIQVRLELNYDPIRALSEISSKVDQVRSDLPPEAEVPTINVESADSRFASAYLSFTSDILADNQITDFLVRVVQPRLSALEGVQRADILGARNFAMRIWLKPEAMAAHNITPSQLRQMLAANNYLSAVGQTKGSLVSVSLGANTDLNSVEEFENLVLRSSGGAIVRLKDIADVELGAESYDAEVRFSGKTAVFMGIWPMPTANSLDVIQLVENEMKALQSTLPSGLDAQIAYDATEYIDNAIQEVLKTLLETLLIVVLVIYFFMGSFRTVLIPIMAIPISLIGAIFLIQVLGFSLNLLTLLAIVLSVGLVVDDAIIIVENIERHVRDGMSRIDAAMRGARELIGPVISTTAVLVAVYLPVGLQGGLTGSLFKEFALTLAGAVVISSIVALTLSPMMASRILREGAPPEGFASKIANGFQRLQKFYRKQNDGILRHRPLVYFVWILVTILAFPLFIMSAKELAPQEDQGVIFGVVDTSSNSTLDRASLYAKKANEVFSSFDETEFTFQITFPTGGFSGMVLEPWEKRERTVFEIQPQVQQQLDQIPGFSMFAIMPPPLPGGEDMPVGFVLASTAEPEIILGVMEELKSKAMQAGLFAFPPMIDTKIDKPKTEIIIDKDKAGEMGLTSQQIGADLGVMLGGNFVNRFNMDGRSYRVIPQVKRSERLTSDQIEQLYITGPNESMIQLSTVAKLEQVTVPRSLNRFQQMNSVTMSGMPMLPLGEALDFLNTEAAKLMPDDFTIDYVGESRQLVTEGSKFLSSFALAIILVFLVLAAQFNSFRDPFIIIMGSVPLAMFGALIFTFLRMWNPMMPFWTDGWTTTMNIYSQVGLVTLVGLVSKNSILIVEFANKLQEAGVEKLRAIKEASAIRLRPILMTAAATVAGHFPLVIVAGAGAEARNSIGIVLVFGMAIGTIFTLYVVPSLYMLIAKNLDGTLQEIPEEMR